MQDESEQRADLGARKLQCAPITMALLVLVLTAGVAHSHDIWLHADRFRLDVGDTLIVRQLLGEELDTDLSRPEATQELPLMRAITSRLTMITDQGAVDLLADIQDRTTLTPVIERPVGFEGLALVTMEHYPIYSEFTNEEFVEYLEHEAVDTEEHRRAMGSRTEQTEAYVRTLKCLVQVGGDGADAIPSELHRQVLGQRIEIVLLQNPYRLDPGDTLEVQVLAHGTPVEGQLVNAFNAGRGAPVSRQQAHTDAEGIARFNLAGAGLWLVRLVNMRPCSGRTDGECEDADWESAWTAYSFELD